MRYLINGRSFTFDEEDLESIKLDEGTEGSCYRVHNYYDDFVMKIHHDKPEKKILDEDTCKVLRNIETEIHDLHQNTAKTFPNQLTIKY